MMLNQISQALQANAMGLELDPNHKQLKEQRDQLEAVIDEVSMVSVDESGVEDQEKQRNPN